MVGSLAVMALLGGCGGGDGGAGGVPVSGAAPSPTPAPAPSATPTPAPPATPTNVRSDPRGLLATFRDADGTVYEALQIPGSSSWLVDAAAPLQALYGYGQSNAGGDSPPGPVAALRTALFPNTVVGGATRFFADGKDAVSDPAAAPLVDLFEPATHVSNLAATLTAFAAERVSRDAGRAPTGIYGFTVYENGEPITTFERKAAAPHNDFALLINDVRRATASARSYGRDFAVAGVLFVQGETPTAGYAASLRGLASDLAAAIMPITGQRTRPRLLIQQINQTDTFGRGSGVELDQLAVAREGGDVVMVGPMYQGPLSDYIHQGTIGRMMGADVAALVFDAVRRGQPFTPLWPTSVVRNGATIDVAFALPGAALAFDTDFVPMTANHGFGYQDETGPIPIGSVGIVDDRTVRIVLGTAPSGAGGRLDYALGNETDADGYAGGRGNLYSEAPTASVYFRLGYRVPPRPRHYAVRFSATV